MTNKQKAKYEWKVAIEYVPFTTPRERERSYEFYAESILNAYRNKQKFLKSCKNRNLESITG